MKWRLFHGQSERRLAARRRRRLTQALQLYGFNEGDGLPTEAELEQERDLALVELLRDFRLFHGTPKWEWLEATVSAAATAESRRITEAGGKELYAPRRGTTLDEPIPKD